MQDLENVIISEPGRIRYARPSKPYGDLKITSSKDSFDFLKKNWPDIYAIERFGVIALNNANKILGFAFLTQGNRSSTVVDPFQVFQYLLNLNASAAILCHNHPSGTMVPSPEDHQVTDRIKRAGDIIGIPVLDHIIFGMYNFYSFLEKGVF